MKSSSLSPLLALLLAPSAAGAASLEAILQQGREAYNERRYRDSLALAMDVLVEEPTNPAARALLRESAQVFADAHVRGVQEERHRILAAARDAEIVRRYGVLSESKRRQKLAELEAERRERETEEERRLEKKRLAQEAAEKRERRLLEVEAGREATAFAARLVKLEAARPRWTKTLRGHLEKDHIVEAYDWILEIQGRYPSEEWAAAELRALSDRRPEWEPKLLSRPPWYRHAALGLYFHATGDAAAAKSSLAAAVQDPASRDWIPPRVKAMGTEAAKVRPKKARPAAAPRAAAAPAKPAPPAAVQPPPEPKGSAEDLYLQGLMHYGTGDTKRSVELFEWALKREPGHAKAKRALERARRDLEGGR